MTITQAGNRTDAVEQYERATAVSIATVDSQGRVAMREAAQLLAWGPESELVLVPRAQAVEVIERGVGAGAAIALDSRRRIGIPFGLRITLGLDPGSQLLVIAAGATGSALLLPTKALTDVLLRLA